MFCGHFALGATEGTDNAANSAYDDGWTNGDDGGTAATFGPWTLSTFGMGSAGFFIGDSTAGSGNINTGGESFAMFGNPAGSFADAFRSFDSAR